MKKILSTHWLILKSGIEKFIVKNFDIFVPSSAGNFKILGHHTKVGINQIFPILSKLLTSIKIKKEIMPAKMLALKMKSGKNTEIIKDLFNKYKSDKSKIHNYHLVYGSLFKKKEKVKKVLEIGLGTDNTNLISNMGSRGKPGASVRAFRDFFPKAKIYGADIDKKILFKDKGINTYYVDQTNLKSLKSLYKKIGSNFDLIIDDGLHAPYANINVIISSLNYLKKDGYLVIEDIPFKTLSIWEVVTDILNKKYESQLIRAKKSFVFLIKKI